jgi:FdhD protein
MPGGLVYDGSTAAVVMATPDELGDLALGFSLTEGLIECPEDIQGMEIVPGADGIELRMWLAAEGGARWKARQRRMIGPTGCGLCGIGSLGAAVRHNRTSVRRICLSPGQIELALAGWSKAESLNRTTRATHAAGFYSPGFGLMMSREDVGRHNALDKLAGALAPARRGDLFDARTARTDAWTLYIA